jgi:hypothetical protein
MHVQRIQEFERGNRVGVDETERGLHGIMSGQSQNRHARLRWGTNVHGWES